MIIDTHCHLFKEFYKDIDTIIKNMQSNIMIVSGTNIETNKEVIDLCNKYNNVFGTLGFHPSELDDFDEKDFLIIENNINNPKIIGVGEIGLDYYRKTDNKDKQLNIFEKQLEIAKKHNKPVVIHSRNALEDTYNVLKQEKYNGLKVMLHCYSYDLEMAKKFTELGFMLGIGGIITFKNAESLYEVIKNIDLKYFLLETDSPFLTPVPYRGKINQPVNIKIVAKKISEIKNISIEKVYKVTTHNALRQFDIKLDL
ncbi:MAG: TatD family hydrolase [Bacilli bacterium]|nr:TatD family hydrolase [Bacilli bacterium]MDD4282226.1 TatD family hydrolase [Bacilli bacterium]MDD4718225.1 TatD family hydrolase [Bacilli bacterium]